MATVKTPQEHTEGKRSRGYLAHSPPAPFPRAEQPGHPDLENLTSDPCCAYRTKRSSHREETIAVVETLDRSTPPAVTTECKVLGLLRLNPLARIGKNIKFLATPEQPNEY